MDARLTNLRYLLWQATKDRRQWPDVLQKWLGCGEYRALDLIRSGDLSREELAALVEMSQVSEEDFCFQELPSLQGANVLIENLRHLFGGVEHGESGPMLRGIGISEATKSRWLSGETRPRRTNLEKVVGYFHLPPDTDLERHCLFLSPDPIGHHQQVAWLLRRVSEIPPRTLQEVFPALRRILEEP